jgi:uncharacterized protein YndB with AHSA1/START domain
MGEQVAVSKDIAAPAELVWTLVSDVTRMGEWSPETTAGEWIKGANGPVVGARFKGTNSNGKKSWSTDATVVDADPGKRFAFDVDVGPVKVARWAYDFEPTATGCTVTETWTDRRNGLIKALGKPISGVSDRATHNRQGMVETLDRLAAAAESAAAESPRT